MILKKGDTFCVKCEKTGSTVLEFAISELKKYLERLGLCEGADGISFSVLESDTLGSEGYEITVTDTGVCILGSGNGVLYGVYEFLEGCLGFCFGSYYETMPQKAHFEIENGKIVKERASLPYRTVVPQFSCWAGNVDRALTLDFIDWLGKNRYNRLLTWMSVYKQLCELGFIPELEKRGIKLTVGHHQATYSFLPPEKYRRSNPEFFKLLSDGTRYDPTDYSGQLVLCSRNEQCIKTFSDNVIAWIRQNPIVDTIALWPNDFTEDYCQCDECQKYTKMENYLYFENEVAKRVRAVMPHVKIDVLIYTDLWQKPQSVTALDDGILIDQANWSKNDLRHIGRRDGGSLIGTDYDQNHKAFRKICKNTVFYDYYMGNYNARQRMIPGADEMQAIFQYFEKEGVLGSGSQFECFNLWNNIFNFFCFARTQYDTSLSFEDCLARFSRLFGEGAEDIQSIIRTLENTLEGEVSIRYAGIYTIEHVDTDKIYSLFESALSKTRSKNERNNIRMLRMAFRYSHLITIDESEDNAKEPNVPTYVDKTGELTIMAESFDSFGDEQNRSGIAIRVKNRGAQKTDDIWYNLD
ncbi:MAG: DUF4838 domain-containing protein [Clostridia bacterium]|nr:DUF4838 domain-containing protein [Clostridia bacterium]